MKLSPEERSARKIDLVGEVLRLSPEERAARKASFRKMDLAGKVEYIYSYYKLPIVVGLVALYLICSTIYREVTKKEVVLYSAHLNISAGETLESQLNTGFILASGAEPKKTEVYLYQGLYLSDNPSTENHEFAYASKLKLMASIEAKQLDVVLMNKEAYDVYSHNGYLLDFNTLLSEDESLRRVLEPHLTTNTVIIEDNAIEYALRETNRYRAVTEDAVNAVDISVFPMFQEAGFSDAVYLGVIANSPRIPAVLEYIEYLTTTQNIENTTTD